MPIQRPGSSGDGDRLDMRENLGRFLLVWPTEHVADIPTSFGLKEAIRADVVVLDAPAGPVKLTDVLLFGLGLIGQLKGAVGTPFTDPVAGRLTQGTAKAGQQPPWLLDDTFGDAEIAAAEAWIAANPVSRLRSAAAPPSAPAALFPPPTTTSAAVPPPPAPPAVEIKQPAAVLEFMAAGWTDEQLAARDDMPDRKSLAAIRTQGKASGRLAA